MMGSPRTMTFPESPMDQDDIVYPCKGCGDILEEGKAFELAGNRWHIDCFRCNTCGTLLDSDANLLLLGDGSLICNNCTYSCNACNQKIEDLAILTGDQAFCANCFKCRNCRRKIDNLRYARTSQGIFCMACHESLMARRRKTKKARQGNTSATILDKSLPALPPSAVNQTAFSPEESPPAEIYGDTPTELSPHLRPQYPRSQGSSGQIKREVSPASVGSNRDNLTLPASTYRDRLRSSFHSDHSEEFETTNGNDEFFVPLTLDPNPAPGPSPHAGNRNTNEGIPERSGMRMQDAKSTSRDYFTNNRQPSVSSQRDALLKENTRPDSSRSVSGDSERQPLKPTSPHIAYQQKGRQPSELTEPRTRRKDLSQPTSPALPSENRSRTQTPSSVAASNKENDFKLQEAPKSRRAGSRRESESKKPEVRTPSGTPSSDVMSRNRTPGAEQASVASSLASPTTAEPSHSPYDPNDGIDNMQRDPSPHLGVERPKRGDSLPNTAKVSRKEISVRSIEPATSATPSGMPERKPSLSRRNYDENSKLSQLNGGLSISSPFQAGDSEQLRDMPLSPPSRSASRPGPIENKHTFTAPRAPPIPPTSSERHRPSESISSIRSETTTHQLSPSLPRYSAGGDFTMDDDMKRIMNGEEGSEDKTSVIRRVSNAVKHGRSFSDRGSRSSNSAKWKSPLNGSMEISSPISSSSPDPREDNILLRNQLRRAQQRIAELEADKSGLQDMVNSSVDIKQVNTELREKRSTIAILNTQRELVVQELEVMTEHLQKAKDNDRPLDIEVLQSSVSRDFAERLQRTKDRMGNHIEQLMQQRTELTNEIADLIQMKDKGFQEYESLSTRNMQLTQLNDELVHSIQELHKGVAARNGTTPVDSRQIPGMNGLGIYTHHQKGKSDVSMGSLDLRTLASQDPTNNTAQEADVEPTVLAAPHVVNIRKGKPNMWKKGGQALSKNIKGIKGAFAGNAQYPERSGGPFTLEGTPYVAMPSASEGSTPRTSSTKEKNNGGWLGAPQQGGQPRQGQLRTAHNQSSTNLPEEASVLFGSDLTARCEFEKRVIPSSVTICIEEVELRGMDAEGVYRKSGGSGQVHAVRQGFEKDQDFDISDPELDIHAVASTLKQYFRRLPTPLISYNIYDQLLDAGRVEDPEKRIQVMRMAINELPRSHRDTLEFLVFHLARVIDKQGENLMTATNLAVVFAPTIMRPESIAREMTDMQAQRIVVQGLLENNKSVFGEED